MHVTRRSSCVYKRGGQGPFQERKKKEKKEANTHILHSHPETWELLLLSPVCNPYYKHFDAR
jgi:hypothetical protein